MTDPIAPDQPTAAPPDADADALDADDDAPAPDGFESFGLVPALLQALAALGYEEPTPIQRQAIPPLLAGQDLLAEAPTGTGKTAAFALPALQQIGAGTRQPGLPMALVLVPTRELAMQVAQAIHRYGRDLGARVLPVYGGQPMALQLRGLQRGVDIVVATPGRALDHLRRNSLRLDQLRLVILDEADEMLDMGFAEELDAVLSATPAERQTALFSATISPAIARVAARHLRRPVRVTVAHERPKGGAPSSTRQVAYVVQRAYKLAALCRLLDIESPTSTLVFARTRGSVDELAEGLTGRGHDAGALHGGLSQEQRDRVMGRFRDGTLDLLVATDVAARGLDISHVSHVVNYDMPAAPEDYVHRIGRTGRAGREGVAITLVEPREHRLLRDVESFTRYKLELAKLPTVADLRERRLDVMRASLRETLLGDQLDRYRAVIEPLADEFDLVDIALAAVSLADAGGGGPEEEVELPAAFLPQPYELRAPIRPVQPFRPVRPGPPGQGFGPPGRSGPGPTRPWRPNEPGIAVLFVGGGRRAGIRPADLVGAIANEAGVGGRAVGAIQIADGYSLVEVPEAAADQIVAALRATTIKGKRLEVRRERPGPGG
jgi:ATP-dependent RNA helicase DeaD